MTDTSERDAVIDWLVTHVGWTLHKVHPQTKGRTVYEFREDAEAGCYIAHNIRQDNLRWRAVRDIAIHNIPEVRDAVALIWDRYVTGVTAEHDLRKAYIAARASSEAAS